MHPGAPCPSRIMYYPARHKPQTRLCLLFRPSFLLLCFYLPFSPSRPFVPRKNPLLYAPPSIVLALPLSHTHTLTHIHTHIHTYRDRELRGGAPQALRRLVKNVRRGVRKEISRRSALCRGSRSNNPSRYCVVRSLRMCILSTFFLVKKCCEKCSHHFIKNDTLTPGS